MEIKTIIAMIGIVASTFALIVRLMVPSTLQVIIEGQSIEIKQIPNIYTIADVAVIGASCFVSGVSLLYLLLPYRTVAIRGEVESTTVKGEPTVVLGRWRKTLEELKNEDERRIYQLIMDENGVIFQGQLVEKSGFLKGKVSLILDKLEARDLLERKRYGMSNIVTLK